MNIGILTEISPEQRVALLPEAVKLLTENSNQIFVEKGAGLHAFASDEDYEAAGAKVVSRDELLKQTVLLLAINPPAAEDIKKLKPGHVVVNTMQPLTNTTMVANFREAGLTCFSLDTIPRISRAQAMDVLSSMATVAGYRAVLEAAMNLPVFFPMFMSAAGTIRPAKLLILGAGVAGLQAVATARKLGAVVEVFDVRAAVKEEVKSLGAKFVEVEGAVDDATAGGYAVEQTEEFKARQTQLIQDHAKKSDVIICTAQIPGRKAPILIKKETVEQMKPGSIIIDLAASSGGNCELTQDNKTVVEHGVKIIGNSNYASSMPIDASRMYGKNLVNFLALIIDKEGNLNLNFEDEVVQGACITHNHQIINQRVKSIIEPQKESKL
ncbi:MAG TPA: Re/Si-specific NAD(P)(+) transhydrogenase subunit alpha [Bacteroidales bacterium]|nr:Re/Si-specific NAD(P)(+) transhydrogenase subunit alpha [Bacteroidales bacterium]